MTPKEKNKSNEEIIKELAFQDSSFSPEEEERERRESTGIWMRIAAEYGPITPDEEVLINI